MITPEPNSIIRFPVYEPAGRDVILSEPDLLQHLLIIGATGSGKTSLLHRLVAQLLKRGDTSLLVFDAKEDDTVDRIRQLAATSGRTPEVIVIGRNGTHHLDLFAPLQSLADVDGMTRRLLAGGGTMGKENAYWEEMRYAMFSAALSVLAADAAPTRFSDAIGLMREWFFSPGIETPRVREAIGNLALGLAEVDFAETQQIEQALNTISVWQTLDARTRSNIQSTLIAALRPLLGVQAGRCFEPNRRPAFDPAKLVKKGGICVVSVNALTDPGLAALLFRLVKGDFLRAVQQRDRPNCLCGVVADELPLVVTPDDCEALATVRSRRCFVAAATQSLAAVDDRIGLRHRNALLANFGSVILLRSREPEVDEFAAVHLGVRKEVQSVIVPQEEGALLSLAPKRFHQQVLVCPPGTLGRLPAHQGFVATSGSNQTPYPLWFVPWYEEGLAPGLTPGGCI